MDPMDVDDERAAAPEVDSTSAPALQEDAPVVSETPDSPASKERAEQPEEAAPPVTRPLDELAVTTPLKAMLTPEAKAALNLTTQAQEFSEADAVTDAPERDPLTPGATLAGYTIERLLRVEREGPVYLATPPADATDAMVATDETVATPEAAQDIGAPPWRYIAREIPASDAARLERVVAAGARGPGLLAPVALAHEQGRAFLISVELPGSGVQRDEPAPSLGTGERLRPVDALTACAQLASALSALHHSELAHLHVSPDRVSLYDGRVYLAGVEDATPVVDPE